jgi:uncharacterized membrane protein YdjX (TVP38/TMEM64 family)
MPESPTDDVARRGIASVSGWMTRNGAVAAFLALLLLIIVPFVIFGDAIEALVRDGFEDRGPLAVALFGGGLLSLDVVLPVPSSLVGVMLGETLGLAGGAFVGAVGLTAGCVVGYAIGFWSRAQGASWGIGVNGRAARALGRYGLVALLLLRPVPVMAEASVIAAGALNLNFGRFLLVSAAANLAISVAYAAIGFHTQISLTWWLVMIGLTSAALLAARQAERSR